jgi:8-oxo-dGTP diphosphatase / 2-hydroxy-dATP diphosphatase
MKKLLTLCIVTKGEEVLLGMKKRGFGAGRWNGFGGKVQEGESIEAAAIRETKEEAGIEVKNMQEVGVLDFEFEGNKEILEVHVFTTGQYEGEPVETEEMRPQWFTFREVPYTEMWPDDKFWLPECLNGKKFKGYFLFGEGDAVLKQNLEIL